MLLQVEHYNSYSCCYLLHAAQPFCRATHRIDQLLYSAPGNIQAGTWSKYSTPNTLSPPHSSQISSCLRTEAKFNRKILNAVSGFVVLDQQPFNVVEAPSFKHLLATLSKLPDCYCPSRRVVKDRVETMADSAVERIRNVLKGTRPAITTDNWTANNGVS